jgi:hypothetical protein
VWPRSTAHCEPHSSSAFQLTQRSEPPKGASAPCQGLQSPRAARGARRRGAKVRATRLLSQLFENDSRLSSRRWATRRVDSATRAFIPPLNTKYRRAWMFVESSSIGQNNRSSAIDRPNQLPIVGTMRSRSATAFRGRGGSATRTSNGVGDLRSQHSRMRFCMCMHLL